MEKENNSQSKSTAYEDDSDGDMYGVQIVFLLTEVIWYGKVFLLFSERAIVLIGYKSFIFVRSKVWKQKTKQQIIIR